MKNFTNMFLLFLCCVLTACDISIFNWDLPKFARVETLEPDQIMDVSAQGGGNIIDDGGSTVQERGICYGTTSNPTIALNKVVCGNGKGNFNANIVGLMANTIYYLRAYAITKIGTAYGNEVVFTTVSLATITTKAVSSITQTTAICEGNVTNSGGLSVTQKGVCYSTTRNPTTSNSKVLAGSGIGVYTVNLSGLAPNTTYYVRAFAINGVGTAYGNEISFTTPLYIIGQSYRGGIIFFIDGTGLHGLIAAPSDQSSGATWGCVGTSIINSTGTAVGSGLSNTTAIISVCSTTGIAARLCYDLVLSGYSDWYLPSIEELNLMYTNLKVKGMGSFTNAYYWSSSQYSSTNGYLQSFTANSSGYASKSSFYRARAIRSF